MQKRAVKRPWFIYGLWSLVIIPLLSSAEDADFNYQLQSDLRSYSYQGENIGTVRISTYTLTTMHN